MLKWCPCMGWCLTDPSSGGEANVLLKSMNTPAYNVRRISSFGQTVINDCGEEEEVSRHGTLPTRVKNGDVPPWTADTIPIQPGVSKSEVAARIHRMTSIPEGGSPRLTEKLKKSNSESDTCSIGSPSRIRKKVPTPQEFAQVTFHREDDHDSSSTQVSSEARSARYRVPGTRSVDIPDHSSSVESIEQSLQTERRGQRERSYSESPTRTNQFNYMKTGKSSSLERSDSSKYPWSAKKAIPRSPLIKAKSSLGKRSSDESLEKRKDLSDTISNGSKHFDNHSLSKESVCEDDTVSTISYSPSQSTVILGDESLPEAKLEGKALESSEIAKQYGLDLNLYNLDDSKIFSESTDLDLFVPTSIAWITFSTLIDKNKNQLTVKIDQIKGLGGEGADNRPFEVVIKLGFIRGSHVFSTKPSPSTKSIDQNFTLHYKELDSSILRLSVYNKEWQASHDALGHSLFRINKCKEYFTEHTLNISPRSHIVDCAGIVEVSYRYNSNILYVIVHKIYDILPAIRDSKVYIKVCQFVSSKKLKEKASKAESCEKGYAVFDFEAKFKAENITDHHTFVIVNLKKKGDGNKLFKHDKTLGRVYLGPLFYKGQQTNSWGQAVLEGKIITECLSFYL